MKEFEEALSSLLKNLGERSSKALLDGPEGEFFRVCPAEEILLRASALCRAILDCQMNDLVESGFPAESARVQFQAYPNLQQQRREAVKQGIRASADYARDMECRRLSEALGRPLPPIVATGETWDRWVFRTEHEMSWMLLALAEVLRARPDCREAREEIGPLTGENIFSRILMGDCRPERGL
jgi:hypothetical protein